MNVRQILNTLLNNTVIRDTLLLFKLGKWYLSDAARSAPCLIFVESLRELAREFFCWKFCIISREKRKIGLSICGLLLSGFSLVSRTRPRKHVPLSHTLLKSTAWMNSQVFETNLWTKCLTIHLFFAAVPDNLQIESCQNVNSISINSVPKRVYK